MSTVTTYQTLQTEGLVTVNFSLLSENFKIIDSFIKAFPAFQRKIADLQKMQKATAQDLSNFKLSTQNTFSTLNDVVESRSGSNKSSNLADSQEMKLLKKQIKEIKSFMTEHARQQQQIHEAKSKEAAAMKQIFENKITELKKDLQQKKSRIINIEQQCRTIKVKYTSKIQMQENYATIQENIKQLYQSVQKMNEVETMLQNLNVQSMRENIDEFEKLVRSELEETKTKLKLKADYSDVFKLEEMLLNIINFSHQYSNKKLADKGETKKALIFLEKKINKLIESLFQDQDGEGLVTTKGVKCISCTKDLGQFEGKLDKYKAWSVFPVKDPQIKDRYSGFGSGFQTIVETSIVKKGGQPTFDQKGRMTAPYNLTRQVQANLLKSSASQSKMTKDSSIQKYQSANKNSSPTKGAQMETSYMINYGKNTQKDVDIKEYYMEKERGLMAHVRYIIKTP